MQRHSPVLEQSTDPNQSHVTGKRKAVARVLQALSRFRKHDYDGPIRSVAILMAGRYGDSILLTKLLRQLKAALPEARLHVITSRTGTEEFFRLSPYVSGTFCLKSGLGDWLKFLLTHRYTVLFNPKDLPSTSNLLLSTLMRARIKVSQSHPLHEGIFDRLVKIDHLDHVTEQSAGLLDALGFDRKKYAAIYPEMPCYPVGRNVQEFSRSLSAKGCIGINLSAGGPSRYWTLEKWEALAGEFPLKQFIVFSAENDIADKKHLEAVLPNVIPSPATENLGEVGSILQQLDLLVTPDTSLVHMAACFDTAVIALFPNDLKAMKGYGPLSTTSAVVASETYLVRDIEVGTVAETIRSMQDPLRRITG